MDENITRLDKRLDCFDGRLRDIEVKIEHNDTVTEANTVAMKELSTTLLSVRDTMFEMSSTLKDNQRDNEEMKGDIKSLDTKIEKLKEEVDIERDSHKFDFTAWFKNNLVGLIAACAVVYYILTSK